jgi:hypothetical protein
VLTITFPLNNTLTNQDVILIYTVYDNVDPVENLTLTPENGTVYSEEGTYLITIKATDVSGNTAERIIYFVIDKTPPDIVVEKPLNNTKTTKSVIEIIGTTEPNVSITINNIPVEVRAGKFSLYVALAKGENEFTIRAEDKAGNIKTEILVVRRKEPEGRGFIPAFEIFYLLLAIFIVSALLKRKRVFLN